jgi:hypothetical protein
MKELEKIVCSFCKKPCNNSWCNYERNRKDKSKIRQDRSKN